MTIHELLKQIKARLQSLYGERLKDVVLIGSEARGDARPDSDIDILALLRGPVSIGDEIFATVDATYELQLAIPHRPIHIMPVDAADYETGEYGFYRIVRREGVLL